jgi:hypothetical protein
MKGFGRSITLAAVAVVLTIALAACGGSSGGDSGGEGGEKQTYENAQYGFTITYGDPLSLVTLTPAEGEAYAIAFADTDGAQVNDEYANGIRVAVNELEQEIKPADVPKLQDQLAKVIDQMVSQVTDGELIGEVTPTEVNGTPGYFVDYQFTNGGEQLRCRLYILIKGSNEFDLTQQALLADWDSLKGTLEETVQTFTLD